MTETITVSENELKQIAAEVFTRHSVDFSTARRAGGWTNATWLAGGLALRLSTRPGNDKIRREARLAALLPAEVGYPDIIETGEVNGHEYSLQREVPARCLGEVWDNLTSIERASALSQMWDRAEAIHCIDLHAAAGLARERAWFNSNNLPEAFSGLDQLAIDNFFTPAQANRLRGYLERFQQALASSRPVLNHGDLTLDNVLWRDGQVVSVLDFEFSVIAPRELDLNTLLKNAFSPAPIRGEELPAPELQQAGLAFARPALAQPGSCERLLGYAVLLELFLFLVWLEHPDGEGPVETWQPYRRLLELAESFGGYYAPVV